MSVALEYLPMAEDDYLGAIPEVPFWNEAMACLFSDPVTSVSAVFYLSRWWGELSTLRHMQAFMLPGDRALFVKNYGRTPVEGFPKVGNFEIRPLGFGRIRYTYDGPMELRRQSEVARSGLGTGPGVRVQFDIVFSSDLPVWDIHQTHPHPAHLNSLFAGGHIDQLGKMSGTLKFGDEVYEFRNVPSCRDHSRGPRHMGGHHSHLWINGQFPSGWGFCCFRASAVGRPGYALNAAAVFKDGRTIPATIETDGLTQPGSDIWKPFDIIFNAEGIEPIRIHVARMWQCYQFCFYEPNDLYWGVPTTPGDSKSFWALEQSGEFHSADGEIGYGNVERCNRDIVVDDHWRSLCTAEKLAR